MKRKLFMALALMVTMSFGCIVFESTSYAQNTNRSTTGEKHMSGRSTERRRHRRWHRRWPRRHRRGGMDRTGNANRH